MKFSMRPDIGGRRSEIDRRTFLYTAHLPERRFSKDRRGDDRRSNGVEHRSIMRLTDDRRTNYNTIHINDVAYG
jgi:hypothetical protein